MASLDHIKLICSGVSAWNERRAMADFVPDFTHVDMHRIDLRAAQLQGADFDGSRFTSVDLAGATLTRARLNGVTVSASRFERSDMQYAEFKGADFTRVSFRDAVMDEIESFDLKIRHSDLRGASLRAAKLRYSHLYNSDLRGARLEKVLPDRLVTKRILIEDDKVAKLEAIGCTIDLANLPTQSEWLDLDRFHVRSQDDDFGIIIYGGSTYWVSEGRWDFFISHASCDKEAVVVPLVRALEKRGQRVWYDNLQIKPGDSLSSLIEFGIQSSLIGVVVISETFFGQRWKAEIKALQRKRIYLVLHGIDMERLQALRPELADRYAIPTHFGAETVADQLVEAIRRPPRES